MRELTYPGTPGISIGQAKKMVSGNPLPPFYYNFPASAKEA